MIHLLRELILKDEKILQKVGGKACSVLKLLKISLRTKLFEIPEGVVITTEAFDRYKKEKSLTFLIKDLRLKLSRLEYLKFLK